jgi:hypothetical protein
VILVDAFVYAFLLLPPLWLLVTNNDHRKPYKPNAPSAKMATEKIKKINHISPVCTEIILLSTNKTAKRAF